mmetsp:Transcript_83619/g.259791  ORF Transcript_83619/g.259791 Transcript_83619/m.259791 type:complete len:200 (-) Transcript_83619:505-1104(-)
MRTEPWNMGFRRVPRSTSKSPTLPASAGRCSARMEKKASKCDHWFRSQRKSVWSKPRWERCERVDCDIFLGDSAESLAWGVRPGQVAVRPGHAGRTAHGCEVLDAVDSLGADNRVESRGVSGGRKSCGWNCARAPSADARCFSIFSSKPPSAPGSSGERRPSKRRAAAPPMTIRSTSTTMDHVGSSLLPSTASPSRERP